jgi:hypothetical protein
VAQCVRLNELSEFKSLHQETPDVDEVGKLLPVVFGNQIRRAEPHLLEILIPLWSRLAGKMLARHSLPIAFESGVLTLTTDCAMWGAQLRQMTEEIRTQVNRFLGQAVVKKLVVKKAAQPELFHTWGLAEKAVVRNLPAGRFVDTTSIADPEVAQAIAGSYAKYFARSQG